MNEKQRTEWRKQWNRQLDVSIRNEFVKIRRFYFGEYNKIVTSFLATGKTRNFFTVFKFNDYLDIYVSLYRSVGLRFAKWSFKELENRQTKNVSMADRENIWDQTFAATGNQIGRSRIVSVQGTALDQVEKMLARFANDPEFIGLGIEEKGRILRRKIDGMSKYQAERMARTETATAANQATKQSAIDFFGGVQNMDKIWNHGGTKDPRPAHIALDGVKIPADQKFNVGGELMNEACQFGASASNVINCGCSVTYVEKEEKETDALLAIALAGLVVESLNQEN